VGGLIPLLQVIAVRAKVEFAGELARSTVGIASGDALQALATAYRGWALKNPGRYPTTLKAPDPDNPDDIAISAQAVEIVFATLAGYGLSDDDAIHASRVLRSALHGFIEVEAAGGFSAAVNNDRSFALLVATLDRALLNWDRVRATADAHAANGEGPSFTI
jgi:hypothetical protein